MIDTPPSQWDYKTADKAFPEMSSFLASYFHQDCDLAYGPFTSKALPMQDYCTRAFCKEENRNIVVPTLQDLKKYIQLAEKYAIDDALFEKLFYQEWDYKESFGNSLNLVKHLASLLERFLKGDTTWMDFE